jgi:hypothetical protein
LLIFILLSAFFPCRRADHAASASLQGIRSEKRKSGVACAPFRFFTPFFAMYFRLLRNSPRPWVKHAHSSASLSSLKHITQKAKSSKSLQPHLIFLERALSMYEIFNLDCS